MDQLPSWIRPFMVFVAVAIVATFAQRKWGSKSLFRVWMASAVIITGTTLFWAFYQHGFPLPSTPQEVFAVAIVSAMFFMIATLASGLAVWFAVVFGPRPRQASSTEVNYFPFNMPLGKLEETDGLAGILRRYQELLATFGTALDAALESTPFHPYLPFWRAFPRTFRSYLPDFTQQARISSRQFDRAPNALMRDLAGADVVLAELETLTPAQSSAIEECHRVNVRRLRQHSILRWNSPSRVAVFVAVIGALATAAERVAGVKPSDLWQLLSGITLTGITLQSNILIVFYSLVLVIMAVTINIMTFRPALRRAQAFEDILTIAKAYRKGESEQEKRQESAHWSAPQRWWKRWPRCQRRPQAAGTIGLICMGDTVDRRCASSSSLRRTSPLLIAMFVLVFGVHGHTRVAKPVSHAVFCSSVIVALTSTPRSSTIAHGGGQSLRVSFQPQDWGVPWSSASGLWLRVSARLLHGAMDN